MFLFHSGGREGGNQVRGCKITERVPEQKFINLVISKGRKETDSPSPSTPSTPKETMTTIRPGQALIKLSITGVSGVNFNEIHKVIITCTHKIQCQGIARIRSCSSRLPLSQATTKPAHL